MIIKKIAIIIFISVLFISCEEDFNPYGDYLERFAFTCILRSDESKQYATLFRSYRPDSFDPYTYTEDPTVKGADIRVWYNDTVFVFKDTSVARTDTLRYKTPLNFYYNDKFFVGNRKPIELEVLLPTGRRLKAASVTPGPISLDDKSDAIIPAVNKDTINILWNPIDELTFFSPRITFFYKQNINGEIIEKEKVVPSQYVSRNGEIIPVYPNPAATAGVAYTLEAISRALEEISAGDPNKSNYYIYEKLIIEIMAFDLHASRYISSTGGTIDDLTVSVDVADYTNIEGGFGLFASYTKKKYTRLRFLEEYIESFGYNYLFEN